MGKLLRLREVPQLRGAPSRSMPGLREDVPWLETVSRLRRWGWGEECPNEDCRRLGVFCLRGVSGFVGCAS